MPTLIFNADDYGLSPGVSRGILESTTGVVRSTTVMGNLITPAEADALRESALACGAHLNLSTGPPLTDYPAHLLTADGGGFDKQLALDPKTWNEETLRRAACLEWEAQLARLRELGLSIGHLDSHHHSHMAGELFSAAAAFAREQRLPLRCRHMMRGYLRASGVRCPDSLVEGYFGAGNLSRKTLLTALKQAQGEVIEVMCHPGYSDDLLRRRSGYCDEREEELSILSDPALVTALETEGFSLGDYSVLS